MNPDFFSDMREMASEIWQHEPILIIVLAGGFIIFVLVVIDAYRHRKKQKARHKKRLH